jgi:hypothetical protein
MSLPNGFYPIVHTFGVDRYRVTSRSPLRESWQKYWWNDDPRDPNWQVFVEGVLGTTLDKWPRTVYYGGPCSRAIAEDYRRLFERWALSSMHSIASTDIIPVQPNASGMRYPRTDFAWYIANETRPPKRYRYIRRDGSGYFYWVDNSFDTMKYAEFHRLNPNVT